MKLIQQIIEFDWHRCVAFQSNKLTCVQRILAMFTLDHRFDFVDGGDVGIAKTDQLAALLRTGAIGPDAVMIGDRASDVAAATANGLRAIGVTWGFGSREELEGAAPWDIVESPAALLGVVDRL